MSNKLVPLQWEADRRVVVKAEHNDKGPNYRCVVTSLGGDGRNLYEKVYCARGEMENRIKEQQLDLFADRTSCHAFDANQFRLLMSSFAYVLLERFRVLLLKGTEFAQATCGSIRLNFIRVGAVVRRNTRRLYCSLSSSCPRAGAVPRRRPQDPSSVLNGNRARPLAESAWGKGGGVPRIMKKCLYMPNFS